jgi:hypothetical protein
MRSGGKAEREGRDGLAEIRVLVDPVRDARPVPQCVPETPAPVGQQQPDQLDWDDLDENGLR